VEAIGGLVELVVGEAPPRGLVRRRRRRVGVDALLGGLVRVAPAAEGQEPLQAPAPEVVHLVSPLTDWSQREGEPTKKRSARRKQGAQQSNSMTI